MKKLELSQMEKIEGGCGNRNSHRCGGFNYVFCCIAPGFTGMPCFTGRGCSNGSTDPGTGTGGGSNANG